MRIFIPFCALLPFACSSPPAASPAAASPAGAAGSDPRCPTPDEPCMNADNHAQCLEVAATCAGDIIQLESCPLQFACDDGNDDPIPDGDVSVSPDDGNGGYDPCAGKACGDPCTICPPDDADCVETQEVKMCDMAGTCSGTASACE